MLSTLTSLPAFLLALVVYGLAPGLLLRVILLGFHRDDPRRAELRAELYAVPRLIRPFWVLEQVEAAVFDGVFPRIHWIAAGRIIHRWHLDSGVKFHRMNPDTFWIPDVDRKDSIQPGNKVRLIFRLRDDWGERMWVQVTNVKRNGKFVGVLANEPVGIPRLYAGDRIKFNRDAVIDIVDASTPLSAPSDGTNILSYCKCCGEKYNQPGERPSTSGGPPIEE